MQVLFVVDLIFCGTVTGSKNPGNKIGLLVVLVTNERDGIKLGSSNPLTPDKRAVLPVGSGTDPKGPLLLEHD